VEGAVNGNQQPRNVQIVEELVVQLAVIAVVQANSNRLAAPVMELAKVEPGGTVHLVKAKESSFLVNVVLVKAAARAGALIAWEMAMLCVVIV
jgi:hypothetical protein